MPELRDYERWHDEYDDPNSSLSARLQLVQTQIAEALDAMEGPVRLLSLCAGEGRDVIGVLARRPDAGRVRATLVELSPAIAARAIETATVARLEGVDVRVADAADRTVVADVVPADIVLLVGIFGNISAEDIEYTIRSAPQLCARDATLLWTRGSMEPDLRPAIQGWLAESGFDNGDLLTSPSGRHAVGVAWYRGEPAPLQTDRPLFTFHR